MLRIIPKQLVFVCVLYALSFNSTHAQNDSPVRIQFDEKSERVDIVNGKALPNYIYAKRGSIQFFLNRLDTPDDFVYFTHDGIRKAQINSLKAMEKVQPKFAIWRLRYKSGSKNTPRIQHLSVSFIPLSPDTGESERRVYVLLNDLSIIDWGE